MPAAMLAMLVVGLTACSSEKETTDEPTTTITDDPYAVIAAPAYADDAKKLSLQTPIVFETGSEQITFDEIELCESGDYVIRATILPLSVAKQKATRVDSDADFRPVTDYFTGSFTRLSANSYKLNELDATMQCTPSAAGESYDVSYTSSVGNFESVAQLKKGATSSARLTNLCRTWDITNCHVGMTVTGKDIEDATFTGKLNLGLLSSHIRKNVNVDYYYDSTWMIDEVIITKAGSLYFIFDNGSTFVGTWSWTDETTGRFRLAWDKTSDVQLPLFDGECYALFPDAKSCTLGFNKQITTNDNKPCEVKLRLTMKP
jgi:hypothetical protein